MSEHAIKQLSIFVNNEPGRLANIAAAIKECEINMKAFNIAESSGFGVLRAIVEDTDKAYKCLRERNIIVKETDVLAITMTDRPGGLFDVVKVVGDANINIEYGYAYTGRTCSAFFFRVDDMEAAIAVLKKAGMKVLKESDI